MPFCACIPIFCVMLERIGDEKLKYLGKSVVF
jgi:hypothetical protein